MKKWISGKKWITGEKWITDEVDRNFDEWNLEIQVLTGSRAAHTVDDAIILSTGFETVRL